MTEDEKFKKLKREISGSVTNFKKEMELIIGGDEYSEPSSSDDDITSPHQ